MGVLRRIQRGNAFYPPASTMKLFTFAFTERGESYHTVICSEVIFKHTWQKHTNKATKCTIKGSCIFSSWTIYTINSQCRAVCWVFQTDFQKSQRRTDEAKRHTAPGLALPHKHVPRERTHGANCWKILHSLDLVTSGTDPKTPLNVSDWCVFLQATENQNVPQHMSVSHKTSIFRGVWLFGLKSLFGFFVVLRLHYVSSVATDRRYCCTLLYLSGQSNVFLHSNKIPVRWVNVCFWAQWK